LSTKCSIRTSPSSYSVPRTERIFLPSHHCHTHGPFPSPSSHAHISAPYPAAGADLVREFRSQDFANIGSKAAFFVGMIRRRKREPGGVPPVPTPPTDQRSPRSPTPVLRGPPPHPSGGGFHADGLRAHDLRRSVPPPRRPVTVDLSAFFLTAYVTIVVAGFRRDHFLSEALPSPESPPPRTVHRMHSGTGGPSGPRPGFHPGVPKPYSFTCF